MRMAYTRSRLSVDIFGIIFLASFGWATDRYYGTYQPLCTGDNFVNTQHGHGGPNSAHRKWNIECLDGEAVIGVKDFIDDFQRIIFLWCKFMFPLHKNTAGLYPYFPNCHVLNLTNEFFCFSPKNASTTVNNFATGWWDDDYQFRMDRVVEDQTSQYKCCRTPPGYFIDYTSCYYKPTRDQFWEYYDNIHFVVYCDTAYVVTGMAKKISPYTKQYHLDWIQCCRLGFSPTNSLLALPVPVIPVPPQKQLRYTNPFNQSNFFASKVFR